MEKRRIIRIFIAFILISSTVTFCYAYFIDNNIMKGNKENLTIANGEIKINSNKDITCIVKGVTEDTELSLTNGKYIYEVNNINDSPTIHYGPVKLIVDEENIHSNIDLKLKFGLGKVDDAEAYAQPLEVIVGDIDNFGEGFDGIDPFTGRLTSNHSIDIYPEKYDAMGTDRRMAPSGFYNAMKVYVGESILGKTNAFTEISKNYVSYSTYYLLQLTKSIIFNGETLVANTPIYFEGYTQRALRGTYANNNNAADVYKDGKNWRYIQVVEPISFKYDLGVGDISSAVFQLFVDDMQPAKGGENQSSSTFIANSSSIFKVYLRVAGSNEKIEITEFTSVINNLNQSGPVGNLVSLSLPKKYFNILKEASGLNKGLELIIDDERLGTSGDSYIIDFAKLTINSPVAKSTSILVEGYVYDSETSQAVAGATVMSGDGNITETDKNGYYKMNISPGIINITVYKSGYGEEYYTVSENTSGNTTISPIYLRKFENKDKIEVKVLIKEYRKEGYEIVNAVPIELTESEKDYIKRKEYSSTESCKTTQITFLPIANLATEVVNVEKFLTVSPGTTYEIEYILKFASQEAMKIYSNFNLDFTSEMQVKVTQENNKGWNVDGSGLDYLGYRKDGDSLFYNEKVTLDNENTKIYFEKPNYQNWWSNNNPRFKVNSSTRTGTISNLSSKWYINDLGGKISLGNNYNITIEDSLDSTKTSGKLYYFNTRKVFICTG